MGKPHCPPRPTVKEKPTQSNQGTGKEKIDGQAPQPQIQAAEDNRGESPRNPAKMPS